MSYPNPENTSSETSYVVLDYHRPSLPCNLQDTVVPVYPEINDMVKVCGSDDDVWLGHVKSVDRVNKSCNVTM